MKILLDNNVPAYLAGVFAHHDVASAFQMGWHDLANGRLLEAAEAGGFRLLVTLDRGFLHQQNLQGRDLAVAVLRPRDQTREAMTDVANLLNESADSLLVGQAHIIREF